MKDQFHLFNIITTTSKLNYFASSYSLPSFFSSYATMMQNYSTEWPPAEALKDQVGGLFLS